MSIEEEHEKTIVVGSRVKLCSEGSKDEYGIVISTWLDPEYKFKDCYVAFWGNELPDFNSGKKYEPYMLRYAAMSLHLV